MPDRSITSWSRSTTAALTQTEAIRASDADREKALGLLRDHWLAGRLTLEEYEERCDEAGGGRFLDDLRRALRELPYPLPEHAPVAPVATAVSTYAPPASQAGAVLSLGDGRAESLAFGPRGRLAAGFTDATVRVYDTEARKELCRWPVPGGAGRWSTPGAGAPGSR